MTMTSGISVIVPTFNNGLWLAETIRSILDQTLRPSEIIVVDDGSTDDTEAVVRSFQDKELRYIKQPNAGVSAARNTGLRAATGEFIAFLDGDDRWRPYALALMHEVIAADTKFVFCFGNFVRFVHGTGEMLADQFEYYPELTSVLAAQTLLSNRPSARRVKNPAFVSLVGFGEFPAYTQAMMFRRALITDLEFDTALVRCGDSAFVLQAALRGEVACFSEIVAEVRRHGGNASRNVELMVLDKLKALERLHEERLPDDFLAALRMRTSRARFGAAEGLLKSGLPHKAFWQWVSAWSHEESIVTSLKRTIGLLLRYVHSTN